MTKFTRLAVLAMSIMASSVLFAGAASAVEPEDIILLYGDRYDIVSVVPSEADPSVYEMLVVAEDGTTFIILVDVASGEIILTEEQVLDEVAADPTVKDECKDGGWGPFGFRNQGQCIRFINTGFDSRIAGLIPEEGAPATETAGGNDGVRDGEACKNGGWEALGFRNQGECMRGIGD
ncbi:MAG: hypothetical protein ACTSWI_06155 [Alphaproteobacteria bacterium]